MVKRIFVFSDMQFNDSRPRNAVSWDTEHEIIKKAFIKAGYEIPEIVYWNLQGDLGKPVAKDEPGVAMVSGFSPNMLKAFLEEGKGEDVQAEPESEKMAADAPETAPGANAKTKLTPEENMLKILGHESFANLKVLD